MYIGYYACYPHQVCVSTYVLNMIRDDPARILKHNYLFCLSIHPKYQIRDTKYQIPSVKRCGLVIYWREESGILLLFYNPPLSGSPSATNDNEKQLLFKDIAKEKL